MNDKELIPKWGRWPRTLRYLAWTLAVWMALASLCALCVPLAVQGLLEKPGSQALGRKITVESVSFNPWSLALVVRGLRVGQADPAHEGAPSLLQLGEVRLNLALASLWHWAPVMDEVLVRDPRLHLRYLGDGHFDVDDLLARMAPGRARDGDSAMPRFSLFNVRVQGGGVVFQDVPKSLTHTVSDLTLQLPFLSNLGARREVSTHPRLAFKLNGMGFDSDAETAPFAKDRHTQAHLQITGLDVAPYRPYWPAAWPLRLSHGQFGADVNVTFKQSPSPQLVLSGLLSAKGVQVTEKETASSTTAPLLALAQLVVKVDEWRPLERVVKLDSVDVAQPVLHVRRDAAGRFNAVWPTPEASPSAAPNLAEKAAEKPSPAPGWGLKNLHIRGAKVHWDDASTRVPAQLVLENLSLHARDLKGPSVPGTPMAQLDGQATLAGALINWQGQTDLNSALLRLKVQGLPLAAGASYSAEFLRPALSGRLSADLTLDWKSPKSGGGGDGVALLKAPQIRVADVTVGAPAQPDLSWAGLTLQALEVDLLARRVQLGRVALSKPMAKLTRQADGRWIFDDWLLAPGGKSGAVPLATSPGAPTAPTPRLWQWALTQVQLSEGQVQLDDRAVPGGVQWDLQALNLQTGAWQSQAPAQMPVPMPLQWRFNLAGARRDPGRVSFEGSLRWPAPASAPASASASRSAQAEPLALQGRLQVDKFPAHKLGPYLASVMDVTLRRADLSYAGTVDLSWPQAGMALGLQGDLAVERLRTVERSSQSALLEAQSLNLRGLALSVRAGALQSLKISETVLSDFFARVAIDPAGHLNWLGLRMSPPGKPAAATAVTAQPEPVIELGPLGLVNGRVAFSDQFVQPHFSTEWHGLTGSLSAVSNQVPPGAVPGQAELSLRGQGDAMASIALSGHINPLVKPMALDVRGQLRDLELPQLSPYSNKYAGYGIERGKLSATLNYQLDREGHLQANHQLILEQLQFGERAKGSTAPNLPVKLAASLLADSQGVIDIQLPVSGSINDPDFQVGAIVWKMVLSLVGKAITSPLSLITGMLTGQESLESLRFAPGSAALTPNVTTQVNKVAQALKDRPGVHLTIVGHSDLNAEREPYRQLRLQTQILDEKRRRLQRDGLSESGEISVSDEEQQALLQALYRRSSVPKPRNLLGMPKALSAADMSALLLAAIEVSEDDMQSLAQARSAALKQALIAQGVPAGQIFLGAVRSEASTQAVFSPRASLTLSTR